MAHVCVCVTLLHHFHFRTILSIFTEFGIQGFEATPKSQLKISCSSYNRQRNAMMCQFGTKLLFFKL